MGWPTTNAPLRLAPFGDFDAMTPFRELKYCTGDATIDTATNVVLRDAK